MRSGLKHALLSSVCAALIAPSAWAYQEPSPTFSNYAQRVPSLAALQAMVVDSTRVPYVTHREGYAAPGDGGAGDYIGLTSNCATRGFANDGGGCVDVASGSWALDTSGGAADMRIWGLTANNSGIDSGPPIRAAARFAALTGIELLAPPNGNYFLNSLDSTQLGAIVAGADPATTITAAA